MDNGPPRRDLHVPTRKSLVDANGSEQNQAASRGRVLGDTNKQTEVLKHAAHVMKPEASFTDFTEERAAHTHPPSLAFPTATVATQ